MKITIEQKAGKDYPANFFNNLAFFDAQKATIRRRLQLRPDDEIIIKEVS